MPDRKSETPAKPDNAKEPADPFGKPKKEENEWTRAAMEEALREPHLGGNDDEVADEELDREKK